VAARGENKIENVSDGLRETRGGVFICGGGEQSEIDGAAGAGDECVGECGAFGDLLKVREKGGVMAGRTLILKMTVVGEASRSIEKLSRRRPQTAGRVVSPRMAVEVARDFSASRVSSRA